MRQINNILCVLEGKNSDRQVVKQAVILAKNHQAKLCLAGVVKKPEFAVPIFETKQQLELIFQKLTEKQQKDLQKVAQTECKGVDVEIAVLDGIPFIAITLEVIRNKRDFVVKTSEDAEGLLKKFSSSDMHLLRKCPCPVLMVKTQQSGPFKNVLATVDFTESGIEADEEQHVQKELNETVVEYALEVAIAESSNLHIGSVWEAAGESFLRHSPFADMPFDKVDDYVEQTGIECKQRLNTFLTKTKAAHNDAMAYVNMQVHFVKGVPEKEIPQLAQENDVDLIVMGTVARTGIPGFIIGNTAESILGEVDCSVLAVKPEGFVSPIKPV